MAVDVGDERQYKERKTKAQIAAEKELAELREVLATPGGRYFVWRLLTKCGIYASTPIDDALRLAAAAAKANLGKWLMGEIFSASPESYAVMQTEAQEREVGK
jgi:hypothetical protein